MREMGPGSAAHRRRGAAQRPGHKTVFGSSICSTFVRQTHFRILAAHSARALLNLLPLLSQEGAGKAGCRLAPTVRCALVAQKELHSGIQVKPNTRPSLRSGLTAYAVLSREPSSFWPPSPPRKSRTPRRLTRMPPPRKLDRSNDGQDHTVLPYARLTCSPHYLPALSTLPEECWRDEPNSVARRHEASGSRRAIRPARTSRARRCRVHRKPSSRNVTTQDRPSRSSRNGRHIRQNRISVKWNILARVD